MIGLNGQGVPPPMMGVHKKDRCASFEKEIERRHDQHDTTPPAQAYPVLGLRHRQDAMALEPEQMRFEIDMCIGCDRCRCPGLPVPSSALVSIADLNHATVSGQFTAQIIQFTTECVLCGSCRAGVPGRQLSVTC